MKNAWVTDASSNQADEEYFLNDGGIYYIFTFPTGPHLEAANSRGQDPGIILASSVWIFLDFTHSVWGEPTWTLSTGRTLYWKKNLELIWFLQNV